jgi:hypothetical protein
MNKNCWAEILTGSDHLEDLGLNGRIILKCTLIQYGEHFEDL